MESTNNVVCRFAPSNTGYLHLGGLRTALYNYLYAKKNNGKFIVRIEDTDQSRCKDEYTDDIFRQLNRFGIVADETYTQSERLHIYKQYAETLVSKGFAYYCFCKKSDHQRGSSYDGHCRHLSNSEIEKMIGDKVPYTIRLKVPSDLNISFNDYLRGYTTIHSSQVDDQVLLKSDGFPTYHLAVVVDDHLMGVTHVIRGEEWIPSTPKHVLLYSYLGFDPPVFVHLPLILNSDKSKMSKRNGDFSIKGMMEQGNFEDSILNYVALLGWHDSNDKEIYSMEELLNSFNLDRLCKSSAIYNPDKLNWYNNYYKKTDKSKCMMINAIMSEVGATNEQATYLLDLFINKYSNRAEIIVECKKFMGVIFSEADVSWVLSNNVEELIDIGIYFEDMVNMHYYEDMSINEILNIFNHILCELRQRGFSNKTIYSTIRYILSNSPIGGDIVLMMKILGASRMKKKITDAICQFYFLKIFQKS